MSLATCFRFGFLLALVGFVLSSSSPARAQQPAPCTRPAAPPAPSLGASASWSVTDVRQLIQDFRENRKYGDPRSPRKSGPYDQRVRDALFSSAPPSYGLQRPSSSPNAFGGSGGFGSGGFGGTGGLGGSGGSGGMGSGYGAQPIAAPPAPDTRNMTAYDAALWSIAKSDSPAEARREAFQTLVSPWNSGRGGIAGKPFVEFGLASDDIGIRRLAASVLPRSPYDSSVVAKRYQAKFKEALDDASKKDGNNPTFKRIAELLRAKALVNHSEHGKNVDEKVVDGWLKTMLGAEGKGKGRGNGDAEAMRQIDGLWRAAIDDVKKSPEFQRQLAWMRSSDFMTAVELDQAMLKRELAKAMAIDPESTAAIVDEHTGKMLARSIEGLGSDAFLALDENQRAEVVGRLIEKMDAGGEKGPNPSELAKIPVDVTKNIAALLAEAMKKKAAGDATHLAKSLDALVTNAGTDPRVRAFASKLVSLEQAGKLSSLGGALSLASAVTGDDTAGIVIGLLRTAEAADGYAKLGFFLRGKEMGEVARVPWEKAKPTASLVRYFKVLGPIADAIGAYQDYEKAIKSAERGEVTAAYLDLAATGLGITSAVVGAGLAVYGFLGLACPPLALVMLAVTVGYVAVKATKEFFVDPDDVAFLKAAGLYQDGVDVPSLGAGGSAIANPRGGVRVINPGTSGFKKGDIISSIRVGITDKHSTDYAIDSPELLEKLLANTKRLGNAIFGVTYKK